LAKLIKKIFLHSSELMIMAPAVPGTSALIRMTNQTLFFNEDYESLKLRIIMDH